MRNTAALIIATAGLSGGLLAQAPPSANTYIEVSGLDANGATNVFVEDEQLFANRCDTMTKIQFWRMVMNMPQDSGVLNIGHTRQVVEHVHVDTWNNKAQSIRDAYRDSVKKAHGLDADAHIYLTGGKSHFYHFEKAIPGINRAIGIFEEQDTDPWYAQAIMLIESPGKLAKSPVGALGNFQLMPGVARKMGLRVDRQVDERKDFDKCAAGAAKLLRTICIPETNKILEANNIEYNEGELWYRLLVLHVYHAGAYNVGKAVAHINPDCGGMQLIQTLWETKVGHFGNASQNYSQVALASMLELNDIIYSECNDIYFCPSTLEKAEVCE